ncbi:hypothetical protein NDU88_006117 [Pleurodeles waltl]|uniref:Uncharacterized protein n=1 Tax=Pleurodeles waltl TaxID=8319 RepID=A0AAV7W9P7_PLEWA|nr:hypothetical protein NDU88_006117 [Pleurodeles waltl]
MFLRCKKQETEADVCCAVIEETATEEDATSENTVTAGDNAGEDTAGEGKELQESSAEMDGEEQEQLEENNERAEREVSTACHIPVGTWPEQVRARIQAWNTIWAQTREARRTVEEGKEGFILGEGQGTVL